MVLFKIMHQTAFLASFFITFSVAFHLLNEPWTVKRIGMRNLLASRMIDHFSGAQRIE